MAAIAACSWYGPTGRAPSVRETRSTPSWIWAASQRDRSWSARGTIEPSAVVRAARRASVSSIRASRPAASPSSGTRRDEQPGEADRLGREVRPLEVVARTRGVALVEDQVQDVQDRRPSRSVRSSAGGSANPSSLCLMLALARLIRWPIVVSGTRNADCDLGRRQAADGPQRQRDLGRLGQRRVAAQEEEGQRVVLLGGDRDRRQRPDLERGRRLLAPTPGALAAPLVHDPPRGDGHQPGARLVRDAALGPLEGRRPAGPPGPRPRRHRSGRSAGRARPRTCGASSRRRSSVPGRSSPHRSSSGGPAMTWRTSTAPFV